ncbi:hypothetical protein [Runella sp. SP2]|uniref:hypothetical protein n=1 Tax=Runella sp. SP2 TaxID=2268026 RepID=UPI000F07C90A|nr:hypothetical protein [Runella sp. SP2]AYQ33973.1 hypothetical protein DTQ70_18235 [Runella sp. SP2]
MKNSTKELRIALIWILLLMVLSCGPSEEQLRYERQQAEQQRIEQEQAEQRQKIAYINAINSVLQLDAKTSNISNSTSRASAMRDIDLTQCPQDFAITYLNHLHAWEDMAKIDKAQQELRLGQGKFWANPVKQYSYA